jgi:hypothetical protein
MEELFEYLRSIKNGTISDTAQLESLLAKYWHEFSGSNEEGMEGYKLLKRMENVKWSSPVLTFIIERHGSTVMGSTRAANHRWELDFKTMTASCEEFGYTQINPRSAKVDVLPIADEIVRLIVERREDERLKWNKDGSVRILIGEIQPLGAAAKQTQEGRRKRFRNAVERLLVNKGWLKVRANVYIPKNI